MSAVIDELHPATSGVVQGTKKSVQSCREMSESVCPLVTAAQDGIANRLHDSVVQELYALSIGLEYLSKQALALVGSLREEIYGLRAAGDLSMADELELVVKTVALFTTIDFGRVDSVTSGLRPVVRDVVKEAVSNAVRHGKADHVTVDVRNEAGVLAVVVRDNGTGCTPRKAGSGGLGSLVRRASALGGSCRLLPNVGKGMSMQWKVPNKEEMND